MTTIAYRDGVLAADSRETMSTEEGGDRVTDSNNQKLFRFHAGTVNEMVAAAFGETTPGLVLLDWLEAKRKPPAPEFTVDDDFGVIVLTHDGLHCYDRFCRAERLRSDTFYAFGSGAKAALGALHAGASAEASVKIACQIDPWSAEPVVAWSLPPPKRRVRHRAKD